MISGDYKYWIQCKADEIAQEKYDCEYYDLPDSVQLSVYDEANEAYKDHLASEIDTAKERAKYGSCPECHIHKSFGHTRGCSKRAIAEGGER